MRNKQTNKQTNKNKTIQNGKKRVKWKLAHLVSNLRNCLKI